MTGKSIYRRTRKKARALTDSLRRHGQPSPSPSDSATDTPGSSRSAAGDTVEGVAPGFPVNQSDRQASVPTPTIRVSPEQQLSSTVVSPNAVSLTEKNRPLTAVCAIHYTVITMLMYPASSARPSRRNQMLPNDRRHRCGKRRSINFPTMTRKAFPSPTTTSATIWKEFWRRR